jgi:hypothetical protein
MDNNPTMLEQLFIPENIIIFKNSLGVELLDHKHLFPHQGLYYRFLGYAHSQKKKMIVKLEKYEDYLEVQEALKNADPRDTINHIKDKLDKYIIGQHLLVGDIKIPTGSLVKKAINIIDKRFKNITNRTELVKKYGYDTKFASHLIRLVLEGIELLGTGKLVFPLLYREYIMDIKQGKYSLDDIINEFNTLEQRMNVAVEQTKLPKYPDKQKINQLSIDLLIKHFYLVVKEEGENAGIFNSILP